MALPAPNLDDRRFQDLVDDCKRLVQRRCPEWTDHNVSDPGVTLIETFAWLTDQVLYRLNRVPDRNYVKFLELLGVQLFPPNAARTEVTFWLSAPQPQIARIPTGTQVATPRSTSEEPVVFATLEELAIIPSEVASVLSSVEAGEYREHDDDLSQHRDFNCFDTSPKPDDALYVGLSDAVPSCVVTLRFDCDIEGIGVDPTDPPLVWEAFDGENWVGCDLERDETGGLNRAGDVVVYIPKGHVASVMSRIRAGWLRARVVPAREHQPAYSSPPLIRRLEAFTIGGFVDAAHADVVTDEILGSTDGTPGMRFSMAHTPVVPGDGPLPLQVAEPDRNWEDWAEVEDWSDSEPDDPHFVVDRTTGEVRFGPAVREPDGTVRQCGRVPPKGAAVRVREYRTGGGVRGNVTRHSISVLKSSLPYITGVDNRRGATGGRDGENIENAKLRGPLALRARYRAVTAEDFEHISAEAALEVARVRCLPADEPGGVRVLLVPQAPDDRGRLSFGQLVPADETSRKVVAALDARRLVGTRVVVEPPQYMGVTVVARLRVHPAANPQRLQDAALEALYGYFHPISGGPDGTGWPFGRPILVGEVYAVLQGLPGLGLIEDARLFAANPVTVERAREPSNRIDLEPNQLVFSVDHQVVVQ